MKQSKFGAVHLEVKKTNLVRRRLNIMDNTSQWVSTVSKDEVLHSVISEIDFPVIVSTGSVFHDLVSCIVEQQIHYRSTKKYFQKRMERAGLELLTFDNFPVFEKEGLRDAKLSQQKIETLNHTVEFFSENDIEWNELSDEEVRARLKSIKGIGTWTQDMILLYSLERPDIFPSDDYHLKNLMVSLYGLNPKSRLKAQMKSVAENWSPFRSFGVRYLLAGKNYFPKPIPRR